jgi:hypothetical protein
MGRLELGTCLDLVRNSAERGKYSAGNSLEKGKDKPTAVGSEAKGDVGMVGSGVWFRSGEGVGLLLKVRAPEGRTVETGS